MGNAKALQALRGASESNPPKKLSLLAIQLGLPEEAEEIFLEKKMFKDLVELYQSQGNWERAIEIAEKHDRISLKTSYHKYGKYLEKMRKFDEAAKAYETAGTAR
jgi:intraflagellar transport protein 140